METQEKRNSKNINKSLFRRILRKILCFFSALILIFAIFCFCISISPTFRQFSLNNVLKIANNFLLAKIEIKDIRFDRIYGISIEKLKIITVNDTLANVEKIIIDVNFESLIFDDAKVINSIEIQNPKINFLRSTKDSLWNFAKIVKPSEPDLPPDSTPSTTIFKINSFKISNGDFVFWDSLNSKIPAAKINFAKMKWNKLNLNLQNTVADLAQMDFATNIVSLAATENQSEMKIDDLKMEANISKKGIEAENTVIKFDNSEVFFDAKLSNFNMFGESEEMKIEKALMKIDLNLENFNPKFIDNFAKIPVKIGKINKMKLIAEGTLNDMQVPKISIDSYQSRIKLKNVRTKNLLNPSLLTYEGIITKTSIKRNDFPNILKNINLTKVPNFIYSEITNTKFFGTLDSVFTNLNLKTGIGNINGNISVSFGKNLPKYNIDLQTNSLNLAVFVDKMQTNINSRIKLKGENFDPEKILANLDLELFNSKINDFYLSNSKIFLDYLGNDTIIFRDFVLNFNDFKDEIDSNSTVEKFITVENLNSNNIINSNEQIAFSGGIGIKNIKEPHFNISANISNFNAKKFFKNEIMPTKLTTNIKANVIGIDLEEMFANIRFDVNELTFDDKSMLPFNLRARIRTNENLRGRRNIIRNHKSINISINNDFEKMFEIDLDGDISINNLKEGFVENSKRVAAFIGGRIEDILNQFDNKIEISNAKEEKIIGFPNANLNIKLEVKSLSFLDIFIDNFSSNFADIYAKINFSSDSNSGNLKIDTVAINSLNFNYEKNKIDIKSLLLSSFASVEVIDSIPEISKLGINIISNKTINISDIKIDSLLFSTNFANDKFKLNLQGLYNSICSVKLDGGFEINKNDLKMFLDSFIFAYKNEIWSNSKQINADFNNKGLTVNSFDIFRNSKENISISGRLKDENLNNIELAITNFELNELNELLFSQLNMKSIPMEAKLDSLIIKINGNFDEPIINSSINLKDLKYEKSLIGNFNANINYSNEKISGKAKIFNKFEQNLFELNINSIPIYLGLNEKKERIIENKPINISVLMNDLPAKIFSPFVPSVDELNGKIKGELTVGGFLPDKYEYSGKIDLDNLNFRIIPINMEYAAFGKVTVTTDLISIENLKIRNKPKDFADGEATVNGKISFDKFELKNIDINLATRNLLILSDKTETSMPWFYGKMIIATENLPLRFYGTLTEPNLSGSVNILNADMKMKQILADEVVKREQKFTYINKNTMRITVTSRIDSTKLDSINQAKENEKIKNGNKKDFVDLLNIDLNIRIRQFAIGLNLGTVGQIFARIGTTDPQTPLNYVKDRNQAEAKIFGGELEVLEGSTAQIFRPMTAKGTISFPTARINRPNLNLIAEHKGKFNELGINYTVSVKITGTATNPQMELSYTVNGTPATGDQKQIESDALMLLTTGILRGYNDSGTNQSNLINEGASMLISQVASKNLTDILMKTGIIQSANLNFEGDVLNSSLFNSANVSISGSLGGFAAWTIGGKIQDITSNYSISIDFPIDINSEVLNNIIVQILKTTDVNSSNFDRNAKNWELKLKLNGRW